MSPGLGHVFLGRSLRGLGWGVCSLVVPLALYFVLPEMHPAKVCAIIFGAVTVAQLMSMADAVLLPARAHRDTSPVAVGVFAGATLVVATVAAVLVFTHVISGFRVGTSTMVPTILDGDQFIVDKRLYIRRPPHRGEAIIFVSPDDPRFRFVMRVLAGPGDRLAFEDGHPIINGWAAPNCEAGEMQFDDVDGTHRGDVFVEFLEGSAYLVFIDDEPPAADDETPIVVKSDEVWVSGDNRTRSPSTEKWSRGNGGSVPYSHVWGRPRTIFANGQGRADRSGIDLGGAPVAPFAELAPKIEACLANAPPFAKTLPPAP